MRSLNNVQVECNEEYLSRYNSNENDSIELILKENCNPAMFEFEHTERELKSVLGRWPSSDEIESCIDYFNAN